MRLAVPGRVERRVTQPEVGGQVDDDPDPVPQGRDDPLRLAVREGAEHEIETVEAVEAVRDVLVGRLVDHSRVGGGQRRRVLPDQLTGVGMGGDRGHLDVGVARQETQELNARVPRSTDDPGLHRISIHRYAYSCEHRTGLVRAVRRASCVVRRQAGLSPCALASGYSLVISSMIVFNG